MRKFIVDNSAWLLLIWYSIDTPALNTEHAAMVILRLLLFCSVYNMVQFFLVSLSETAMAAWLLIWYSIDTPLLNIEHVPMVILRLLFFAF